MVWRSRLNRRNRRWRGRWSHGSRWRRWNIERNCRPKERVQLVQARRPRLRGCSRRGHVLDFIVFIGWKILIG
jgi:hypothetical protein